MTAVIERAEARLAASTMIRSSMIIAFTGPLIDWMMKTSAPRTLSR
jgi:hypothetical protein